MLSAVDQNETNRCAVLMKRCGAQESSAYDDYDTAVWLAMRYSYVKYAKEALLAETV